MGYCKVCQRSMTDPYDCDCRCPHGDDVRLSCVECEDERTKAELADAEYDERTASASLDQFIIDCATDCVEAR